MNKRLSKLLQGWVLRDSGGKNDIFPDLSTIEYLGRNVFDDYEPSQFDIFEDRLDRWLHNVTDETDQQTLFLLLNYLFFIGRSEFDSLYRTAYNGHVFRWLVDQLDVDIEDPAAMEAVNAGIEKTWFCPITDSMRINSFLKVNKLPGKSHRPDWRSLRKFGDPKKILKFVADNQIQRIVLLEDFVGTGDQMQGAIKFAAGISADISILALPLVVCPVGDKLGISLTERYVNVSYQSVLVITPDMLIKADPQCNEPPFHQLVRDLILRVRTQLGEQYSDHDSQRYHGYKGTGAVVALYSNCPDNSLPIIHDKTEQWQPLFPRINESLTWALIHFSNFMLGTDYQAASSLTFSARSSWNMPKLFSSLEMSS